MMWHMSDGWGWSMLMNALILIGFWAGLIWIAVSVTRRPSGHRTTSVNQAPTALEILERRYASGELSDEEFESKRERLRGSRSEQPSGTTDRPHT